MNKTEATLIVTKDNLILVNDEKIEKGELYLNELYEIQKAMYNFYNHKHLRKIIAQSPNIKLSKELADELGWVDVEELAEEEHKYNHKSVNEISFRLGVEIGFKAAQELNKKEYSEEDMKTAIRWGCNKTHLKSNEVKVFIQSLQQPKQIKVTATVENGVYYLTKAI
jgi:hypothetical protein